MVGPLVAGHLANYDPIRMPWLFAGISCLLSAAVLAVAKSYVPSKPELSKAPVAPRRTRRKTLADKMADELSLDDDEKADEDGSSEDYEELWRFVGNLLRNRHYPWVSKKEAVQTIIRKALPKLHTGSKEQDLEELLAHHQQTKEMLKHKH
jgi:flagellar motility protein MotE (MotC chaperone)